MTAKRSGAPAALVAVAAVVVGVLTADGRGWAPLTLTVPAVAVAAAVLVVLALRGVEDLAVGLLVVAVGTATWNGLSVSGLQVAHASLAAAGALLLATAVGRRRQIVVPPWVWVLPGAVLLVGAAAAVWPTGEGYLAQRAQVDLAAVVADTLPPFAVANVLAVVGWVAAAAVLPVAVCLAVPSRPRLAGALADAWALGAVVNATVAVTDELGLTRISAALLPLVDVGGRQAGLGAQPNHLAVAVALTVPVVTWRLLTARSGTARAGWVLAGGLLAAGLVASGSRGGAVGPWPAPG
ncbi:hypothetical protein JD79_01030 [Geodermatophilus normandii]|uniref:Uncharacterized protein n=1 Tax=Geodermatophilus normandii TaxID=1137989 RepID=A0A317QDT9_9ACTN|nr:hypothetical protein [Geodermatophilus normandii]PWW21888.1 hypothetical protein JD79_01030 [Geodermatophilus normandii]